MRKIYLIATPVLLLLAASGFSIAYLNGFENEGIFHLVCSISLVVLTLLSLIMMFKSGTFRKTLWSRFAFFGIAILIIGMLFTIQHWEYNIIMVATGTALITGSYLVYFVRKAVKNVLDWIKAVVAGIVFLNVTSALTGFRYKMELNLLCVILGLILICLYYVHVVKDKKQVEAKLTTQGDHLFDYPD